MTTIPATTTVRFARPEDTSSIVAFIRGLAEFEHEPLEQVHVTEADVVRDGFGDRPLFEALIAEQRGAPVGFALFFPHYSTWEGRAGLYVEDLYVTPEARSSGAGHALLAALARVAHDRGWPRLDLSVLDWNPARAFYEAHGMAHQQEWLPYRMERDAIDALASEAPPLG
jgi:GNAT superfamily N-acetyltransferase